MTGHRLNRSAQDQKRLISGFANDHDCTVNDTGTTIVVSKDGRSIEMKPKTSEYTDLNTSLSYPYYNAVARLRLFFNINSSH